MSEMPQGVKLNRGEGQSQTGQLEGLAEKSMKEIHITIAKTATGALF